MIHDNGQMNLSIVYKTKKTNPNNNILLQKDFRQIRLVSKGNF